MDTNKIETISNYLSNDIVRNKIEEMLKDSKKAANFITSVITLVSNNESFRNVDKHTILTACLQATSLDLPINSNLGFAHIIPYAGKCQFQMGYKGFIQLAQRSGQFETISDSPVYEGQLIEENPLTGFVFDWKAKKSDRVIGYVAYFKLLNGFSKMLYMTIEDLDKHARKYSQTYKKGYGNWKDNFDAMARKTVLKLLLSKYAPLSTEMQKAILTDQSIIHDFEGNEVEYIDNSVEVITTDELKELYKLKKENISPEEQINIERILDNEETKSYSKLKSLLTSI